MKVHDLKPAEGATKRRKRVGRGIGGKGGKTAGRGTKGQKARSTIPVSFEGGQLPLSMRVPKLKGFNNPFRVEYQAINLDTLEESGLSEVSPETLLGKGLVSKGALVKVLGRGEVARAVHGEGPRVLEVGRGSHHGRRRHRRGASQAVRCPSGLPRQRPHQPLISPSHLRSGSVLGRSVPAVTAGRAIPSDRRLPFRHRTSFRRILCGPRSGTS